MPNGVKHLEESATLNAEALEYIHRAAERGLYEIRGLGAKRKLPTFDDLVFLTASLSRYPLEGYRERCDTTTVLGTTIRLPVLLGPCGLVSLLHPGGAVASARAAASRNTSAASASTR